MTPDILRQAQSEMFRRFTGLLLSDREQGRTINAIDDHTVEILGPNGVNARLEFDPSTGLPVKETYQAPGVGGAPTDVAQTFSDWRETGGFKLPFKVLMEQGGKKVADITVSEYKFNTGLTEEEISKRP